MSNEDYALRRTLPEPTFGKELPPVKKKKVLTEN
tara:strand:+ start:90 stop:191 length:102 start_codon:yes stop_codon:yes gene_type:complete